MQRARPANGTKAKQFIDAVNGSDGRQHLNSHATRRQFPLQTYGKPHTAIGTGSDDQPLRMGVQQRAKIFQA